MGQTQSAIHDADWYWDWLKHSDMLVATQGGLFIVAETILVPVALSPSQTAGWRANVPFAVGLAVAIVWAYLSCTYVLLVRAEIVRKLEMCEPRWKEYRAWRKGKGLMPGHNKIFGTVLPFIFVAMWLVLWVFQ